MIIVARHGETDGNAARVLQVPETPLNAHGMAQAERLAQRLAAHGPTRILCSDLARARMTAAPLERATGLAAELVPELQERNFGALRGRSYAELSADIFHPSFVPDGGESMEVFDLRVAAAWRRVVDAARSSDGHVVAITHGFVCASLARQVLSLGAGRALPSRWGNTSVTLCEPRAPHTVHTLNCTAHLDAGNDDTSAPSGL